MMRLLTSGYCMKSALKQIVSSADGDGRVSHPNHASPKKHHWERFTCGRVYPQIFAEKENGAEPCAMQTECLLMAHSESPRLRVTLGFLQPIAREMGAFESQRDAEGQSCQTWLDAVERKVSAIVDDFDAPIRMSFVFPASESREPIQNENGGTAGVIFRRHEVLEGRIETKIIRLRHGLYRICARVVNLSSIKRDEVKSPEKILLRTFASTHFELEADGGEFVSLLTTPPELQVFADGCRNIGCWPVLAGDRKAMIASPMIIGDYPQVMPENSGEFADGTEVGEIPAVRVLTLSDESR